MSTGYLTTHVLDTARGVPAAGIAITLWRHDGESRTRLAEAVTNADGRTDAPILPQGVMTAGEYELVFDTGAYLDAAGVAPEEPRFLSSIPIRFGVSDEARALPRAPAAVALWLRHLSRQLNRAARPGEAGRRRLSPVRPR